MKKADVIKLAQALEGEEVIVQGMGLTNVPTDPYKRVEAGAAFRFAKDRRDRAREAYQKAFDQWYAEGCPE